MFKPELGTSPAIGLATCVLKYALRWSTGSEFWTSSGTKFRFNEIGSRRVMFPTYDASMSQFPGS